MSTTAEKQHKALQEMLNGVGAMGGAFLVTRDGLIILRREGPLLKAREAVAAAVLARHSFHMHRGEALDVPVPVESHLHGTNGVDGMATSPSADSSSHLDAELANRGAHDAMVVQSLPPISASIATQQRTVVVRLVSVPLPTEQLSETCGESATGRGGLEASLFPAALAPHDVFLVYATPAVAA